MFWPYLLLSFLFGLQLSIFSFSSVVPFHHKFISFDGVVLDSLVYLPPKQMRDANPKPHFPLIVLLNSWDFTLSEYKHIAFTYVSRGYVVVQYETRGFGTSGGNINFGGIEDIKDGSSVITQILSMTEWQVNPNAIAFMGISYGAGLSLLITANDERVTTCLALSGWAQSSLIAVTNGYAVNEYWVKHLRRSAFKKGKISQYVSNIFNNTLRQNLTFLDKIGKVSSPLTYLDSYNRRKVPLFISHNFGDPLILPQTMISFFEKLTGPKFLMLNQGTHAAPSFFSQEFSSFSTIWKYVHLWMDHWLMNKPNGCDVQGQIRLDVGSLSSYFKSVEITQPSQTPSTYPRMIYYLQPRMNNRFGTLSNMPANIPHTDSIYYSKHQSISIGIPLVSEFLTQYNFFHKDDLLETNRTITIIYESLSLNKKTRLCGTPTVSLSVRPPQGPWQLFIYLYAVVDNDIEKAYLLSYTGYTYHTHNTQKNYASSNGIWSLPPQELHSICVDVPADTKLFIAIGTHSKVFELVRTDPNWKLDIVYSNYTKLSIPYIE